MVGLGAIAGKTLAYQLGISWPLRLAERAKLALLPFFFLLGSLLGSNSVRGLHGDNQWALRKKLTLLTRFGGFALLARSLVVLHSSRSSLTGGSRRDLATFAGRVQQRRLSGL